MLCCGITPSAEAQQFFNRTFPPPDDSRGYLYCNLIDALVTADIWSRLDWLHVYAADNEAIGLTNFKADTFRGYWAGTVGLPTWTRNRGYNGNGTNYIDSQFNPSTAGGNYTQSDASVFVWSLTAALDASPGLQDASANSQTALYPRYTDGSAFYAVNAATQDSIPVANGLGFYLASRTASNLTTLYKNGVSIATSSRASVSLKDATLKAATGGAVIAMAGAGSGLSSGHAAAFYAAGLSFMQGLGAA